jgi:hypothetical protein
MDIHGNIMKETIIPSGMYQSVSTAGLSNGIYFLQWLHPSGSGIKKLLIQQVD